MFTKLFAMLRTLTISAIFRCVVCLTYRRSATRTYALNANQAHLLMTFALLAKYVRLVPTPVLLVPILTCLRSQFFALFGLCAVLQDVRVLPKYHGEQARQAVCLAKRYLIMLHIHLYRRDRTRALAHGPVYLDFIQQAMIMLVVPCALDAQMRQIMPCT